MPEQCGIGAPQKMKKMASTREKSIDAEFLSAPARHEEDEEDAEVSSDLFDDFTYNPQSEKKESRFYDTRSDVSERPRSSNGPLTVARSYDGETTKGRVAAVIPIAEPLVPYLRR